MSSYAPSSRQYSLWVYDYKGNEDTYTISNVKYDVPVAKETFQF